MRARLSLLAVPICLIVLGVFASTASAGLWCVTDDVSGCSPDHTMQMTQAGLTAAIAAAQGNGQDDDIEIGAGTLEISSQISINADNSDNLMITGAGSATVLHFTQPTGNGLNFSAGGAFSTGIDNLSIKLDGISTGTQRALWLYGGTASNITFDVTSSANHTAEGAVLENGASCNRCNFDLSGGYPVGVYNEGPAEIRNSVFRDTGGETQSTNGISGSGSDLKVYATKFVGLDHAVTFDSGNVELYDSVADMDAHDGAQAIYESNDNPSTSTLTLTLDGVTVVGHGLGQRGLFVEADTSNVAHEYATATVKNSLFFLTGSLPSTMRCVQGDQGIAAINVDYTLKNSGSPSVSGCTQSIGIHNLDSDSVPYTAADLFVDYAGGDLRLAPGAPVIDKGDAATDKTGRDFDAFGNGRFVDGGAGVPTIDLGGGEYQDYAPEKPAMTASSTTAFVGDPISFTAASSDANGDPVTYAWSFADGSSSSEQNPTHTFTAAGTYAVDVWAHAGGLQSLPGRVVITVSERAKSDCCSAGAGYTNNFVYNKPSGKFKFKKGAKLKNGFALSAKKPKGASIKIVTTGGPVPVTLTLFSAKGKQLKGAQKITFPLGTRYLTFGGKWNRKSVGSGKYTLQAARINGNDMPSRISMNVTVPKQSR